MHIHQIEIDNFKSFVGKTTIPFEPGFTTVSGPNGSGKSNIVDSILFCLGLSTSRTMRAEKLTDLINHHSKRREAQVTITFLKPGAHINPEKRGAKAESTQEVLVDTILSSDFPEDAPPKTEGDGEALLEDSPYVTVSRRIREGSNGPISAYYLHGRPSTLTEIHEYLGQFHVSPGSYNVMMQGDVQGIVNMSAMERRKIIDEVAGVADFDRKIDQAQKELSAAAANIERNQILLAEIESRMEALKAEREKALKYKGFKDEKQRQEALLLFARLQELERALTAAKDNMVQARQEKQKTQQRLTTLQGQLVQTRDELHRLSQEVKRKGEDQQIAIQRQIEGLKGHIHRKQDAIARIKTDTQEANNTIQQLASDISNLHSLMGEMDQELDALGHQRKELQGLYDTAKHEYEKLNKKFDTLTDSGSELTVRRSDIRKQLEAADDRLSYVNRNRLDLEAERDRISYNIELKLGLSHEAQGKIGTLSAQIEEKKKFENTLLAEKQASEVLIQKHLGELSKLRATLQSNQGGLNDAIRKLSQLEAQKKAYEEVSFSRPVEMILQSGIAGVHGTLAQLCSVEGNYSLALEIAMGGRLQNVVVEDDRVAKACIEYLREHRGGVATFLPLNKIRASRGLPALPRDHGVVDFALNLLQFDRQYEDIFAYAVGETLIMEDLDSSRRLLNRYRMVTLDGSILEKTGAMTGGSVRRQGTGALNNTKQLEEEITRQHKHLTALEEERQRHEARLTKLEMEIESAKATYNQTLQQLAQLQAEREGLQNQVMDLESVSGQSHKSPEIMELTRKRDELQKTIDNLQETLSKDESIIAGLKGELEAIEEKIPTDQFNALKKELDEAAFNTNHFETQLRDAQEKIREKERERQYKQVSIEEYQGRIEKSKANLGLWKKEEAAHLEEIALTENQIKELEAQTAELDEELQRLQKERDAVQGRLISEEKEKSEIEGQIHRLDEQIIAFQQRAREIEPQIREAQAAIDSDREAKEEALRESTGDPEATLTLDIPEALQEEEIRQVIQKLLRKMEALEPVNMLAIEEYDAVTERQTELKDKVDTLVRESEALTIKINGYEELKRVAFMDAFQSVDESFKVIFGELSAGQGRLILTNPSDPLQGGLTIEAQPRGKKMIRLEAMSGGEKSLTSLAFVFSLQRYRPAPFYALDEVDQNLDGMNVEKLAHMISREAERAQFIVVSLRKPMIENSQRTVGVTQKLKGITKITGIKFREIESKGHRTELASPASLNQPSIDPQLLTDLPAVSTKGKKTGAKSAAAKKGASKKSSVVPAVAADTLPETVAHDDTQRATGT